MDHLSHHYHGKKKNVIKFKTHNVLDFYFGYLFGMHGSSIAADKNTGDCNICFSLLKKKVAYNIIIASYYC